MPSADHTGVLARASAGPAAIFQANATLAGVVGWPTSSARSADGAVEWSGSKQSMIRRFMPFVLASASPRRRELLAAAGIDVAVDPVHVDETRLAGEPPEAYVERVARLKAAGGAGKHPGATVIAADTAVVLGDEVLGKPVDAQDAARMLRRLSGRDHEVLTAVAVVRQGMTQAFVERTVVTFTSLSDADVDGYVATGEPFDKAGAYAIQGGAARFVTRIQGSYTNVVGLPMERLIEVVFSREQSE